MRPLTIAALLSTNLLFAQPGSLDPSFDQDGLLTVSHAQYMQILPRADGTLWLAFARRENDSTNAFHCQRRLEDGSLDLGFGTGGEILVTTGPISPIGSWVSDLLEQSNGRILLVISTAQFVRIFGMHPDGTMDQSFGQDGVVEFTMGDRYTMANACTLQSDDALLIAGTYSNNNNQGGSFLWRCTSNGLVDANFASGGSHVTLTEEGYGCRYGGVDVIDQTGNIIVIGQNHAPTLPGNGAAVRRFNSSGEPLMPQLMNPTSMSFGPDESTVLDINEQGTVYLGTHGTHYAYTGGMYRLNRLVSAEPEPSMPVLWGGLVIKCKAMPWVR